MRYFGCRNMMPRAAGRWLAVVSAAALAAALALSGCGQASQPAQAEQEETQYSGKLTVGFDQDFPPFSFAGSDGECSGFDVELVREICARENLEFVPVLIKWSEKDALLGSGDIDCISGMSVSTREESYAWTVPYVNNRIVVLTAKRSDISDFTDLAGKRVYVQTATSQASQLLGEDRALENTFSDLCMVDECSIAVLCIIEGKADACVLDVAAAEYYVSQHPDVLKVLDEPLSDDRCGFAFSRENGERALEMSGYLRAISGDGTLEKLAEKWGVGDIVRVEG